MQLVRSATMSGNSGRSPTSWRWSRAQERCSPTSRGRHAGRGLLRKIRAKHVTGQVRPLDPPLGRVDDQRGYGNFRVVRRGEGDQPGIMTVLLVPGERPGFRRDGNVRQKSTAPLIMEAFIR